MSLETAILDGLTEAMEQARPRPHPLVARAKRYIDERYAQRLCLSRIAAALGASPGHLSRLFARQAGLRLTAYIHRARLRHAIRLLVEHDLPIKEIAFRVGYQNYRDFHRNFVRHEKASPSEVRRRLRGRR